MVVIPTSHVNVEKKIFNPDDRIRRSIVLFDVYGCTKGAQTLYIDEALRVHKPSISCNIAAEIG